MSKLIEMSKVKTGIRRSVWMPTEMDTIVEDTRKKLGMRRSAFYKYAITRLLQEISVLSTKAREDKPTHLEGTPLDE